MVVADEEVIELRGAGHRGPFHDVVGGPTRIGPAGTGYGEVRGERHAEAHARTVSARSW